MRDCFFQHCLIVLGFVDLLKICLLIKNSKSRHQVYLTPSPKPHFAVHENPQEIQILIETIKAFLHFSTLCNFSFHLAIPEITYARQSISAFVNDWIIL